MDDWMTLDRLKFFRQNLDRWLSLSPEELAKETGDAAFYKTLHDAKSGTIVVNMIEGGNEYLSVGHSKCGKTRTFAVGLPLALEMPKAYYQSGIIESIDWQAGTFSTNQSVYSFRFLD